MNGITITNGLSEYNSAFRLVRNMRVTGDKNCSIDNALQLSFPDQTDTTVTTVANFVAGGAGQVAVSNNLQS